jgi:hypothetical protein
MQLRFSVISNALGVDGMLWYATRPYGELVETGDYRFGPQNLLDHIFTECFSGLSVSGFCARWEEIG